MSSFNRGILGNRLDYLRGWFHNCFTIELSKEIEGVDDETIRNSLLANQVDLWARLAYSEDRWQAHWCLHRDWDSYPRNSLIRHTNRCDNWHSAYLPGGHPYRASDFLGSTCKLWHYSSAKVCFKRVSASTGVGSTP